MRRCLFSFALCLRQQLVGHGQFATGSLAGQQADVADGQVVAAGQGIERGKAVGDVRRDDGAGRLAGLGDPWAILALQACYGLLELFAFALRCVLLHVGGESQ